MDRRLALLPVLALAGTSLSGCVAVAIPALAGSAVFGTRVIDNGEDEDKAAPEAVAVAVAAPAPAAAPAPTPPSAATPLPAPSAAPRPVPVTVAAPRPAPVPRPVPAPIPAPAIARVAPPAPAVVATPAPRPAPPVAVAAAPVAAIPPAATSPEPLAYPDPARPLAPGQANFARFVRYGQASALGARDGADLLSAVLSDPVALDGKRRRCAVGEQPVALIDLDPRGGIFMPPANPAGEPGLALGLAVLREAGVEIAWVSDLPTTQSGTLRTALEQSGLDPRGQDIISLRRDETDTKQQRKDSLAAITCIVAIAGDERADFDDRFRYLRSPAAGAGIEPLIGDGWFLIESLFAVSQGAGQ